MDQERFDRITSMLTAAPTPVSPSNSLTPWQPMARRDHLVITHVGEEVLVYDKTTHAIHRLNATSHAIWAACDGTRTVTGIGQVAGAALGAEVSEAVMRLALTQLSKADLLVDGLPADVRETRQSRRTVLRRAVIASGVALPVLVSVSAPTAASIVSCTSNGNFCSSPAQCCSGVCLGDTCGVIPTQPAVPTADTSACGRPCSSNGDCAGVCGTCTNVGNGQGGALFVCQP